MDYQIRRVGGLSDQTCWWIIRSDVLMDYQYLKAIAIKKILNGVVDLLWIATNRVMQLLSLKIPKYGINTELPNQCNTSTVDSLILIKSLFIIS